MAVNWALVVDGYEHWGNKVTCSDWSEIYLPDGWNAIECQYTFWLHFLQYPLWNTLDSIYYLTFTISHCFRQCKNVHLLQDKINKILKLKNYLATNLQEITQNKVNMSLPLLKMTTHTLSLLDTKWSEFITAVFTLLVIKTSMAMKSTYLKKDSFLSSTWGT